MTNNKAMHPNALKFFITLAIIVSTLLAFSQAYAVSPINDSPGVTLKGYDTVAYFTEGKPVKGSQQYEYVWMGAKWRFSSATNRGLFAKNPEKYAPQYGGYCAYAVAQGVTADIDPTAWNIVDGKLYLNLSHSVARLWMRDIPGYIAKGDKNWPSLVDK
jgi:YHS domain-containing protein